MSTGLWTMKHGRLWTRSNWPWLPAYEGCHWLVSLCYSNATTDGANPEPTRPHVRNLLCGTIRAAVERDWLVAVDSSLGLPANDEPSRRSDFWTVLKIDLRLSYELLDPWSYLSFEIHDHGLNKDTCSHSETQPQQHKCSLWVHMQWPEE